MSSPLIVFICVSATRKHKYIRYGGYILHKRVDKNKRNVFLVNMMVPR